MSAKSSKLIHFLPETQLDRSGIATVKSKEGSTSINLGLAFMNTMLLAPR